MALLDEFRGITNAQAYVKIFSERMMKPAPGRVGEYLGCDHRKDMLPFFQRHVAQLPNEAHLFDVGAGAGDVVDFALKDLAPGSMINLLDPNPVFLRAYRDRVARRPHLRLGMVHEGPLQDWSDRWRAEAVPREPQHLILAVHMIYHLTDFADVGSDPRADLYRAIASLYQLLDEGGSLFVAYSDLNERLGEEALAGLAPGYFESRPGGEGIARRLREVYRVRNELLGPGGTIAERLQSDFPQVEAHLESEWRSCHFYGESVEDLAVLALAAELCSCDSDPFDVDKLAFCLDAIERDPKRFGIQIEERDLVQKGLWRGNQPHILATITKRSYI